MVSTKKGSWSDNGDYWAYPIQTAGSDWERIKIRDAKTLKDLPDELVWVKFSGMTWTHDSKGFFYSRYAAPEDQTIKTAGTGKQKLESPRLYYHRLG